uniref:Uncharacterized protein n=1 Tax=Knipowitschia caucasica TaxID=637954 RepID=A0AAV2JM92_KNICA
MAGPREIFTDVNAFLACTKNVCEFCTKKEQSNERHLRRKHLQKAVYFFHQQKECFTVAWPTPPTLLNPQIITNQATVNGYTHVKKGHLQVRFQEYTSGFHNFNDRVLLTLPLCHLLLSALANKTAPGRMLSTITHFNDSHFHHQTAWTNLDKELVAEGFLTGTSCGHCANYDSYSLMEHESEKVLDIQTVQSNEVGRSFYMEKEES